MKKLISALLVVMMVMSMATVASADNTTTLTTTVPAATYTLNIPANQEIPFGTNESDIGNVTVTDANGFATGKNLKVTITWDDFVCSNVVTTIPFIMQTNNSKVMVSYDMLSEFSILFEGSDDNGVAENAYTVEGKNLVTSLSVKVKSEDWGKALAGEYSATITFAAEVVAGE